MQLSSRLRFLVMVSALPLCLVGCGLGLEELRKPNKECSPRRGPSTAFVPKELPEKVISFQRENMPWELVFPSEVPSQNRGTNPRGERRQEIQEPQRRAPR